MGRSWLCISTVFQVPLTLFRLYLSYIYYISPSKVQGQNELVLFCHHTCLCSMGWRQWESLAMQSNLSRYGKEF